MTSIFAGAFAFGVGFDVGITKFWDSWNRGVRPSPSFASALRSISSTNLQKQWKDIRDKYISKDDE